MSAEAKTIHEFVAGVDQHFRIVRDGYMFLLEFRDQDALGKEAWKLLAYNKIGGGCSITRDGDSFDVAGLFMGELVKFLQF